MASPQDIWQPASLVTLVTDFGLGDAYVGVMKGVIASVASPAVRTVDLTHAVAAQDVAGAAFHLSQSWRWFPRGTVHVAVCDPGVGTSRSILVATGAGHAFLAPDNGLLGPVLADVDGTWVGRLDVDRVALPNKSATFHGRDVFAPAAARIAAGADPRSLGTEVSDWERLDFPSPEPADPQGGAWTATVLSVDRFGNLVGNVPADEVGGGTWQAVVGDRRVPLQATYGAAQPGELLALVDSYGLVELAVRDGSAAEMLGMNVGDRFRLERMS